MSVIYMLRLEEEPDSYDLEFRKLTHQISKQVHDWIEERIKPYSRVLDLGCGTGILAKNLAKNGCSVLGIDQSQKMIEYAKSTGFPSEESNDLIEFKNGSVLELDSHINGGIKFDAVVSTFLLTEMRPLQQQILLREIWQKLSPEGVVYLAAEFPPDGIWKIPFNLRRSRYLSKLGRKKRGLAHPTQDFKKYLAPIGFELVSEIKFRHGEIRILELRKKSGIKSPGYYSPNQDSFHTNGFWGFWGKFRCLITGQVDNVPIEPGLYQSGNPNEKSPIIVTANYLYTFIKVRQDLKGIDAWILVLDSRGINVWCAARGGEFGNEQLMEALRATDVKFKAKTPYLILPQLSAGGIQAPKLRMRTEACPYEVIFGPTYSRDLPKYITSVYPKPKPPEMRLIHFSMKDRALAALTHTTFLFRKIFASSLISILILGLILRFTSPLGYNIFHIIWEIILGVITANLLLILGFPLVNFTRSFLKKGVVFGLVMTVIFGIINALSRESIIYGLGSSIFYGWLGIFVTMSFSGYSTVTSVREIRLEYPVYKKIHVSLLIAGVLLYLAVIFLDSILFLE